MTILGYLIAAFACFVFALVIIHELKKAPKLDTPSDRKHERLNSINPGLRDRSPVRNSRIQAPKRNER